MLMKHFNFLFVGVVLFALLLQTSCSIEKRHYRSGFYVESKSHKTESATVTNKAPETIVANVTTNSSTMEEVKPQTIFHQKTETVLHQASQPLLAQQKSDSKTTIQKTNNVKQVFKAEALKAFKENSNALAFYANKKAAKSGGKNQIVAFLLCWFLGFLGIHSFYLGNTTKGAIQLAMFIVGLLTFIFIIGYVILVALGIWVLVDFIRLIIGDLGPGW